MSLNKQQFSQYIREFNFRELFNEMGWNNDKTSQPITVDNETFTLQSIAEKRGFKILVCSPTVNGIIPDSKTRKKLETKVTKLFQEHLIIFADKEKSEQIWQLVVRKTGKPTKTTETRYYPGKNQDPELLFQRAAGIFFEFDEEENITIVDVTKRIAENFNQNTETVVKRFYTEFSKQHKSFYEFVSGIDDHIDALNNSQNNKNKQWYVSLMLNRLMFCYFIQKQRFLDNNQNYLREKLAEYQANHGRDQFYDSFYKNFLMVLFHDGLGAPNHDEELRAEIGKIPYLNGGLFDVHELEDKFTEIDIQDQAFENIFDFFDDWTWHLDTRKEAKGKDINPDVIGYIFEKYINDRAQMGAYYTKEDITDYISKNCILPFLFDETKRGLPKAFSSGAELWAMLQASDDRYIYDAVKHGVSEDLPGEIEIGLDTDKPNLLKRRKDWNKSAPSSQALPTEIWREVVDRRRRYREVKEKIENGEIESINDFITHNLNITQFAQDVIENTDDPKFLEAFYKALNSVTIIDPTCGSGAFLFAAMNILESLYESCLQRMRNFIEDEDRLNKDNAEIFTHKFSYFRDVLRNMQSEKHPNQQYFIYKNIILHNLYGVDIMKEAVEIAKLRLFLKLVASVEADQKKENLGLEPLPDIDFNIRSGNTLIGYVSQSQIDNLAALLVSDDHKRKLLEDCEVVSRTFKRYKEIQLSQNYDYEDFKLAKHELNVRLNNLNKSLNKTLFQEHYEGMNYGNWKDSHQPFHWFAEFYGIIHDKGGFDVIIGNPPYIEYSKVKKDYELKNYKVEKSGNLYAFVVERCLFLSNLGTHFGMIIPMSSICTDRAVEVQKIFKSARTYISSYSGDRNPAEMFDGVKMRLTIFITSKSEKPEVFTTRYNKWYTAFRPHLIDNISYGTAQKTAINTIPKVDNSLSSSVYSKIHRVKKIATNLRDGNKEYYFHNAPIHWVRAFNFVPYFCSDRDGEVISSHYKTISAETEQKSKALLSILNSSLFYYWFIINSNSRDLSLREIGNFCFNFDEEISVSASSELCNNLMNFYKDISKVISVKYKSTGDVQYEQIDTKLAKPIIDKIDKVLAKHYGFTEEELDFIINYDIKYRMGKTLDGDSDE